MWKKRNAKFPADEEIFNEKNPFVQWMLKFERKVIWINIIYVFLVFTLSGGVLLESCSEKFRKICRKTPVPGSLF